MFSLLFIIKLYGLKWVDLIEFNRIKITPSNDNWSNI